MSNLRRLRAEIVENAQALILKADAEKRDLTDDERTRLTSWRGDIAKLEDTIKAQEEIGGFAAEVREVTQPTKPEPKEERDATWAAAPKPPEMEKREREFRFGQFLQAVQRSSYPGAKLDPILIEHRAATGASETIPSDGGFLVGTDYSSELLRRAYMTGQITSRCRRIPISAGSNSMKINGVDETSRASGSRWGGMRGYWVAEAGTITSSKPKFYQIALNLHKLAVLAYATDEVLEDAATLGAVIMEAASQEILWLTENSIVNGTGVGMPLGVLNAPATVSVTKETGQAATTFVTQNVTKMYSRMWAGSRPNSAWFINQDVEPQLHQMSLAVGTGGVPVYLPANGLSGAAFDSLYGRPVVPIEYCPTLGTVGDVVFADFSQYLLAEKGGIQSASSIHVQWLTDETTFRFIYRVDGQPLWHSALTPANGSNTLSPFITLATRA